jgi:hypothetical protein
VTSRDNLVEMLRGTLAAAIESVDVAVHLAAYADLGDMPQRLGALRDVLEEFAGSEPLGL